MIRARAARSRSPRRVVAVAECRCCHRIGLPLDFGRDSDFCSQECYRQAGLGAEAVDWDADDVTDWMREHGAKNWCGFFHRTGGMQLLVSTNERTLRKLGMPKDRCCHIMNAIVGLRQGAFGRPEPPLSHLPLPTVAVKGKQWNENWKNVLANEPMRSFAAYCPKAIDDQTAWEWFEQLRYELPWEDLTDTKYQKDGKKIPRRTVFVVSKGCKCVYQYSGVKVPPTEEPEFVARIRRQCAKIAGYSEDEMPNSCNINLYRDGHDSVGWHTDNEPLFDSEAVDSCILSLSLGATRNFHVRKQDKWCVNGREKAESFAVSHGDLCTMEGMFQKYYLHAVPKESHVYAPRINLTWRWITRHNKASGCKLCGEGN